MKKLGMNIGLMLLLTSLQIWARPAPQSPEQERQRRLEEDKQKDAQAAAMRAKLDAAKAQAQQVERSAELVKAKQAEREGAEAAEIRAKLQKLAPAAALKTQTISPLASLQDRVKGTFWRDAEMAKMLDLSSAQQAKMDEVFQQYRLKLIDQKSALEKEEVILEPLFGASRPLHENESKILTQIDRIANARAELEKTNSKMLIGILQVLTPDQWNKLSIAGKPGLPLRRPLK